MVTFFQEHDKHISTSNAPLSAPYPYIISHELSYVFIKGTLMQI